MSPETTPNRPNVRKYVIQWSVCWFAGLSPSLGVLSGLIWIWQPPTGLTPFFLANTSTQWTKEQRLFDPLLLLILGIHDLFQVDSSHAQSDLACLLRCHDAYDVVLQALATSMKLFISWSQFCFGWEKEGHLGSEWRTYKDSGFSPLTTLLQSLCSSLPEMMGELSDLMDWIELGQQKANKNPATPN